MLIDDAKGALAALKAGMQEDRRIKSGTDLNVGDIVYQDMDRNDGLVLNKGYDDRLKFFVIVGKNLKGGCHRTLPDKFGFGFLQERASYATLSVHFESRRLQRCIEERQPFGLCAAFPDESKKECGSESRACWTPHGRGRSKDFAACGFMRVY